MSDDLIARLHALTSTRPSLVSMDEANEAMDEAAAKLARLRAEVERLKWERDVWREKMDHALQCERDARTALADERAHADALAEALTMFIDGGNRQLALISRKVKATDPMTLTVTKGQLLAAIEARAAHRARRQG
ncbi:hypothetical protein [Paracoccus sp. (in: a-proteobacteria)]|uniref:hypothetical protein n=1 Tax=Paracoccus sp. TaxID=267 RepID=UPI002AFFC634|nr:hypothetical protein [Paracoccus sp. (in: a-proteobacteria)]